MPAMTDPVKATQSVLDAMVAGVMSAKSEAAKPKVLTPVGTEAAPPSFTGRIAAPFPYDNIDMLVQALDNIEREVAWLREAFGVIKRENPLAALRPDPIKLAEHEADARAAVLVTMPASVPVVEDFDAAFEAKVVAAQVATFEKLAPSWKCPVHKSSKWAKTKRGRDYAVCAVEDCPEFERLEVA